MSSNYDSSSPTRSSIEAITASVPETEEQRTRREAFETQLTATEALLTHLQDTQTLLEADKTHWTSGTKDTNTELEIIQLTRTMLTEMDTCRDSMATLDVSRLTLLLSDPGRTLADYQATNAQSRWDILQRDGERLKRWCATLPMLQKPDSPTLPDGYEEITN